MSMRVIPDSVLGRTALVLVAALLLSAAAAMGLFAAQRQEALTNIGGRNAAERVGGMIALMEQTPPESRHATLHNLETPRFRVGWGIAPIVVDDETIGLAAYVRSVLEKGLEGREIRISTQPAPPGGPNTGLRGGGRGGGGGGGHMGGGGFHPPAPALRIAVRLNDGSWLNVLAPFEFGDSLWRPRFVLPLLLALVLVTAAALWAVRKATLPFAAFAAAAERLGVDVAAPPLKEDGPREVRQAAQAFNIMQGRIARMVQDRTQMLAAISHDLKTPITRLRLRAEFMEDDEQRTKMLADLEEMEAMIAATLAFARDDATSEPRIRLDLAAMVQGMADDLEDLGTRCTYDGPSSLVIEARPAALKRALGNLVDNAIKYGGCARLALTRGGGEITLTINDDGPGIPEADFERVFAPFVRLEASRSRDTGGSGLGLAVARAAIRAHGGDIRLANRPEGGLRVTVSLPIS
ncbi:two-component sensor histidine kinase [Paramagnetospirillum marisnigri]|uniref:histidine kinase n=1 Tax=Paramagnetospirillum marisnigri TaxID=1285242 RepID=A0A178MS29_9PROT|nr:ATP-binding protein [Paramagnetospirillum marisnigri]OAN51072.1 two-component sensor histidine kinase [Paramagnetospirillum marisnigri]